MRQPPLRVRREAALADAQVAVAKVVLQSAALAVQAEFRQEGASVEALSRVCRGEAAARAVEAVEEMATQLVFGGVPVGEKAI